MCRLQAAMHVLRRLNIALWADEMMLDLELGGRRRNPCVVCRYGWALVFSLLSTILACVGIDVGCTLEGVELVAMILDSQWCGGRSGDGGGGIQ